MSVATQHAMDVPQAGGSKSAAHQVEGYTIKVREPPPPCPDYQQQLTNRFFHSAAPQGYYKTKIEASELAINKKTQNLRRLEAQRNALNARGEPSPQAMLFTSS